MGVLVVTLMPIPWYSFEHSKTAFTFSLYNCVDCEAPYRHISPDCFDSSLCRTSSNTGLCRLGPDLQLASDMYFYNVCLSLLFLVLNTERLYCLLREKDYGHPKAMAALIPVPLITTVIGVGGWFGNVKPSFDSSCSATTDSETPCVTLKFGAYLALVAAVLTLAGGVSLFIAFFQREKGLDSGIPGIGEGKIIAFTFRNWLLTKVGPVLLIAAVFIGVSFLMPWIKFEDTQKSYQGDLRKMLDSLAGSGKPRYECLWGPACDAEGTPGNTLLCNAFKRMSLVSSIYLGLESCVLLFFVLWLESLIYFALKREFGIPRLVYCYPVLTTLVHTAAVMLWFIYGGAKMGGDCQVKAGDTDINFCAETGASFTIWEGLCFFFAAIFYELLYYRRRDGYTESDVVSPEMPSKLNATDSEIVEPPNFSQKAFEHESTAPPPSKLASKVTGLSVSSRMQTQHMGPTKSQSPFKPTLETLEEKSYCVSCDDE